MAITTTSWEEVLPAAIAELAADHRAIIEYSLTPRRVFSPTKDLGLNRAEYSALLSSATTCLRDILRRLGLCELSDLNMSRPSPCRIHKYGAA